MIIAFTMPGCRVYQFCFARPRFVRSALLDLSRSQSPDWERACLRISDSKIVRKQTDFPNPQTPSTAAVHETEFQRHLRPQSGDWERDKTKANEGEKVGKDQVIETHPRSLAGLNGLKFSTELCDPVRGDLDLLQTGGIAGAHEAFAAGAESRPWNDSDILFL